MTTLTLSLLSVCDGGTHVRVQLALNGTPKAEVVITPNDITTNPTDADMQTATAILLRAYKVGRTLGQVKTALQSGIDVVL